MPKRNHRQYVRGPHIFQRSNGVFYGYTPDKPKGFSLGTRDRAQANKVFAAILAGRLQPGRLEQAPSETSLIELVEQYLQVPHGWTRQTRRTTKNRLVAFGKWATTGGLMYPAEITPTALDRWIRERQMEVSRRTINRDLRALRLMIAWASNLERELCTPNSAIAGREYLREPHRHQRHIVPDPAEMRRIFHGLHDLGEHGALIATQVLYLTGLRIEELRRLTPFDFRDGALYVSPEPGAAAQAAETKGYRERSIPLPDGATEILRCFFAWRSGTGGMGKQVGCSESWLIGKLHKACARAKIKPHCGLHDLRRAFATEAVRRGVDLIVVSHWLGHRDIKTTELYLAQYRSDRDVVAPMPTALADFLQAAESESPSLGIWDPQASRVGGKKAKKAQQDQSYPSDLNRRPAVYETAQQGTKAEQSRDPIPQGAVTGSGGERKGRP